MNDYLSPVASRHTRTKHLHDHHTSHRVNPDDTDDYQTSTMAHKIAEPYSGKNPVPTIATKLTSLVNPDRATEAKARQLQDQSARREEKQTEKTADKLSKGHVMHATDPTTGEELDIRNADEEPETQSKGDNVLHQEFPPPGELPLCWFPVST